MLPDQERFKQQLAEGFRREWAILKPLLSNKQIVTVYFGGGTPSLFGPDRIADLIRMIKGSCDMNPQAEITLEANPENISQESMQAYAEAGINRVSIGIQTLDSRLLNILGRYHNPEIAMQAVHNTYLAGISNISIDLMYDIPQQTLEHWETTLSLLHKLPIKHLSLYNLTIEPHTLFFKKEKELRPLLPDEDASLAMYERAIVLLEAMGLQRYEISAFAQPGFESRHNTGYWTGRPFLGLGPSAFSYWEGKRFRNVAHLSRYCKALEEGRLGVDFEEQLDPVAARRELLVIRLRLREGVLLEQFEKEHGILDPESHRVLRRLIDEGYVARQKERMTLSHKGILFYDTVAAELV